MPLAEKLDARVKRYRAEATLCRDADMLRRFFALKEPYTSVIPLKPEPAVQFDFTASILEGLQALDQVFYADVAEYMKAAEPKPVMSQEVSQSKRHNGPLAAGFEALDREFYSIADETASSDDDDDDEEAASDDESARGGKNNQSGSGVKNTVAVNPQNALLSLFGDKSEGGSSESEDGEPKSKYPRRLASLDKNKYAELRKNSRKKK